jgi:hypothetical protein
VSQGSSIPGAPVTAVPWNQRFPFALFVADRAGGVYTAAGDPQNGFGPWGGVAGGAGGRTTPGAPVTAVPWRNRIAVFLADPNGGIYTAVGDPQAGFGPWASVSEGRSTPGARVTVVPWGDRIAVFLADPNGGIYTTSSRPATPTGLRVTNVAANEIDVAWIDDANDEDGFHVKSSGKKAGQPDDPTRMTTVGADERTASVTGLLSGYEYTITVEAFDTVGDSVLSNPVQATTPEPSAFISARVLDDPDLNAKVLEILGNNFQPAEFVNLQITTRIATTGDVVTEIRETVADSLGNIDYKYVIGPVIGGCNPPRSFEVQATGITSSKKSNVANAGCQ